MEEGKICVTCRSCKIKRNASVLYSYKTPRTRKARIVENGACSGLGKSVLGQEYTLLKLKKRTSGGNLESIREALSFSHGKLEVAGRFDKADVFISLGRGHANLRLTTPKNLLDRFWLNQFPGASGHLDQKPTSAGSASFLSHERGRPECKTCKFRQRGALPPKRRRSYSIGETSDRQKMCSLKNPREDS